MRSEPDRAGVRFPPPFLLAGLLGLGWLLQKLTPLVWIPARPGDWIGTVLLVLSVALFLWAVVSMQRFGGSLSTHTPTPAIVVRGPYAFSRNPIYLAMVGVLVAAAFKTQSAWFLILAAAGVWLYQWGVIWREEAYLSRKFGVEYAAYRERVRRWL